MKPSEKALIKAKRAEKRSREKLPALSRVHLKTRIKYVACMAGYILLPIALWLTPATIFTSGFCSRLLRILRWATIVIAVVASFFLMHVIVHPEWAVKKEEVKA